jgi:uncharacterized protein (DUF1684 family)
LNFLYFCFMKRFRYYSLVIAIAFTSNAYAQDTYLAGIDKWHKEREEGLKKENGWLNLAGLFWLKPGKNYFGSDAANDLVFPKGTIAPKAGYLELEDNNLVILVPDAQSPVSIRGRSVTSYIYHPDSSRSPVAAAGSLRWTIIRRDDKIGVRLRDLNSPAIATFRGIERYRVDPAWKLEAVLQSEGLPGQISITNVLGQTNLQKSAGKLHFSINGRSYSLHALDEGDDNLFVIFGDATNTDETYPSGRFLYVQKPDASGKTVIDFNKAYNPPCAFTEYATCPLPPKENRLTIAITAGEKKYTTHY